MFYWTMLFLAIITEVIGTSTMKLVGDTYPVEGYFFLFTTIGLSYYFLSKAISRIPMGIAYAMWEGLGIAAITVIGYFIFQETLTSQKLVGIMTVICGICLLKSGSITNSQEK